MCPKRPDINSKRNTAIEGNQYNEEDRSMNILNIHSHKQAITASWIILAVVVIFVLFCLYKKLESRMIARAEQRRIDRTNTASLTIEDLVAEIRGRREQRAPVV